MNRRIWFSTVVPIAALLYVIFIMTTDGKAGVGAIVLAIVVVLGFAMPLPKDGRQRNRARNQS